MIQHIVMWKFKTEAEGKSRRENAEWVKEHLSALPALIPEIKEMKIELDESGNDENYDAVLLTVFDSLDALHTYKVHPAHVKVSSYVAKTAEKRACVDYQLD